MSNKDIKDAIQLWSFVLDTSKFNKSRSTMLSTSVHKIIKDVATTRFETKPKPRPEVILVAQFIANIDPSYLNSDGQYVEMTLLRTQVDLDEDTLDFVCSKIEEIVKPYINVSGETTMSGQKLKVDTTMPKKKLIHAAIRHLINGSEIFKEPNLYHELKARAMFTKNIKANYAWFIGLAISLKYNSVLEMMEDMCIKFIDQTKTVNRNGQVVFYDGTIRTENL